MGTTSSKRIIRVMVRVTQMLIRSRVKYRMSGSQLLRAVSYQDFFGWGKKKEEEHGVYVQVSKKGTAKPLVSFLVFRVEIRKEQSWRGKRRIEGIRDKGRLDGFTCRPLQWNRFNKRSTKPSTNECSLPGRRVIRSSWSYAKEASSSTKQGRFSI